MPLYRNIHCTIWGDTKFRALSPKGKLVFFFLLTHPQMSMLGAMRASEAGLAVELNFSLKDFRQAFSEGLELGMVKYDPGAPMLWFPNFLRYNQPQSPNVVRAWRGVFDLLPECNLKSQLLQRIEAFAQTLSQGFRDAFLEAFGEVLAKAIANQEQEQEQETGTGEQDQEKAVPHYTLADHMRTVLFGSGADAAHKRFADDPENDFGTYLRRNDPPMYARLTSCRRG